MAMRIFIFLLFIPFATHLCFSQMWKEPLDTLPHIDKYERIDSKTRVKSCMIKKYVVEYGNVVDEWEYKEFDERGRISKSSFSEGDTTYYYYNEFDVCQEIVYPGKKREFTKRVHVFDEHNRLKSIVVMRDLDTMKTHFVYENNLLVLISYSKENKSVFHYDSIGRLKRKEINRGGQIEEYFDYTYGEGNTCEYSYCYHWMLGENRNLTCDRASAHFNSDGQMTSLGIEINSPQQKFFSTLHFKYNIHGKVEHTFELVQDKDDKPYEIKYFYNEQQLLIRTEYYLGGEMYMHYTFEWVFR